jgi:hypothetical protein
MLGKWVDPGARLEISLGLRIPSSGRRFSGSGRAVFELGTSHARYEPIERTAIVKATEEEIEEVLEYFE